MTATLRPRRPLSIPGARRGALPSRIDFELATLVREPPAGADWIHETKFDGYRVACIVREGTARLLSRNGLDWTSKFRPIATAAEGLAATALAIDGEVVVADRQGISSFEALQRLGDGRGAESVPGLCYHAFDLVHLDGFDLTAASLLERKATLDALLARSGARDRIRKTSHVLGGGGVALARACKGRLEGIVSKRADSAYRAGRGHDWQKSRCGARQELVIVGWTPYAPNPTLVGALLLATFDGRTFRYAGRVGTGFDLALRRDLAKRLGAIATRTPPCPDADEAADVRWAKPVLVGEVSFTQWTRDGRLRHPSFLGLRLDKSARDVRKEQPGK